MTDSQSLLAAIDRLVDVMRADAGEANGPPPGHSVDWLLRIRTLVVDDPGSVKAANARRNIHAALICGDDHTSLERAWTRYRADPELLELLNTIEALTLDPMYPCPCCGCLTMPQAPPGSWARCPVCGWNDYVFDEGGGPNPPIDVVRERFVTRDAPPRNLRDPRPEEMPPRP